MVGAGTSTTCTNTSFLLSLRSQQPIQLQHLRSGFLSWMEKLPRCTVEVPSASQCISNPCGQKTGEVAMSGTTLVPEQLQGACGQWSCVTLLMSAAHTLESLMRSASALHLGWQQRYHIWWKTMSSPQKVDRTCGSRADACCQQPENM